MGPYQRTPKEVARAIGYSGLVVHSVGPTVGDFLDVGKYTIHGSLWDNIRSIHSSCAVH